MKLKEQKNLKVIMKLRDDLDENERIEAVNYVNKWKEKFDIECLDNETYCKIGNNLTYNDDFGSVTFFYSMMRRVKKYYSKKSPSGAYSRIRTYIQSPPTSKSWDF